MTPADYLTIATCSALILGGATVIVCDLVRIAAEWINRTFEETDQ